LLLDLSIGSDPRLDPKMDFCNGRDFDPTSRKLALQERDFCGPDNISP